MPRKTLTLKKPPEVYVGPIAEYSDPSQKPIAVVGGYPETWAAAPFGDSSWEIWAFSRGCWKERDFPRWDRWFELHNPAKYPKWENYWPGYTEWLKSTSNVTELKDFPRQELLDRFGPWFFQTGQAPWLMAYAITLNPSKIGIWGVECRDQYRPQRLEMQHFIQLARDQGIEVVVPDGCSLLDTTRLYE